MSTSSILAISTRFSKDGCTLLEHHLETVFSDFSNRSASHLLVNCFSTNTDFILFISPYDDFYNENYYYMAAKVLFLEDINEEKLRRICFGL